MYLVVWRENARSKWRPDHNAKIIADRVEAETIRDKRKADCAGSIVLADREYRVAYLGDPEDWK
jgi:hypothetical protein